MAAAKPQIKRPGLLGVLAALSLVVAVAACLSLVAMAQSIPLGPTESAASPAES